MKVERWEKEESRKKEGGRRKGEGSEGEREGGKERRKEGTSYIIHLIEIGSETRKR